MRIRFYDAPHSMDAVGARSWTGRGGTGYAIETDAPPASAGRHPGRIVPDGANPWGGDPVEWTGDPPEGATARTPAPRSAPPGMPDGSPDTTTTGGTAPAGMKGALVGSWGTGGARIIHYMTREPGAVVVMERDVASGAPSKAVGRFASTGDEYFWHDDTGTAWRLWRVDKPAAARDASVDVTVGPIMGRAHDPAAAKMGEKWTGEPKSDRTPIGDARFVRNRPGLIAGRVASARITAATAPLRAMAAAYRRTYG